MSVTPALQHDLLAAIPALRASAMSLCGKIEQADDLVQQTLVKAWDHIDSFEPGTNLAAWLYTILRNEFYTEFRKRQREVQDADGKFAQRLAGDPAQESHMNVRDVQAALLKLRADHREALMLIGGSGMSYEEAASACGCAVGTMKSRVSRARARLNELLSDPVSGAQSEPAKPAPAARSGEEARSG